MNRKTIISIVLPVGVLSIMGWFWYSYLSSPNPTFGAWLAALLSIIVCLIVVMAFSFEFENGEDHEI